MYNDVDTENYTAQKMKFFIKDFFNKCDKIHSFLLLFQSNILITAVYLDPFQVSIIELVWEKIRNFLRNNTSIVLSSWTQDVNWTSRTSSERLMYVQFMPCIQGVDSSAKTIAKVDVIIQIYCGACLTQLQPCHVWWQGYHHFFNYEGTVPFCAVLKFMFLFNSNPIVSYLSKTVTQLAFKMSNQMISLCVHKKNFGSTKKFPGKRLT